jgi:exopolyphosphatase / guanosine-5'-triphosphate,3'-diphosphate pyrophosphatase
LKVAAVDIGTNSMRLLMVHRVGDGPVELGRYERVTGLGRGVDATGELNEEAVDRTLLALSEFGARMRDAGVDRRRAVATSASRDARNREKFFDKAELALGVRPEMISGDEEARLAFAGATDRTDVPGPHVVIDIGGGSTEFVTLEGGRSFDIGSVRLTDRVLKDRPSPAEQVAAARAMVAEMFLPVSPFTGSVIGVAGTWTSLARIKHGQDTGATGYSAELSREDIRGLVERLGGLTVEQTAALPGLDPARAPVILAGAVVAEGAAAAVAAEKVTVSEHDLLDGVVAGLLR